MINKKKGEYATYCAIGFWLARLSNCVPSFETPAVKQAFIDFASVDYDLSKSHRQPATDFDKFVHNDKTYTGKTYTHLFVVKHIQTRFTNGEIDAEHGPEAFEHLSRLDGAINIAFDTFELNPLKSTANYISIDEQYIDHAHMQCDEKAIVFDSDLRTGKSYAAATHAVTGLMARTYKTVAFISIKQMQSSQQIRDVDMVAEKLEAAYKMQDYRKSKGPIKNVALLTICINSISRLQ